MHVKPFWHVESLMKQRPDIFCLRKVLEEWKQDLQKLWNPRAKGIENQDVSIECLKNHLNYMKFKGNALPDHHMAVQQKMEHMVYHSRVAAKN